MDTLLQPLQPLFATAFTAWGADFTWIELVACVLAVAMVVLNMRVQPLAWPLAIASSLLYGVFFWKGKLYGEAGLQLVFIAVAGWGWWQWLRGRTADGATLTVRSLSRRGQVLALAAVLAAWPALALFLDRATDSPVPWWDAFPTAGSLVGQWLLGRKYLENWPAWVVVNVASVALFAYKEWWLTTALYTLFVAMSFAGWLAWSRLARRPALTA